MCMSCGCGEGKVKIDGQDADAEHQHIGADGIVYRHVHAQAHPHTHAHAAAHNHAPGVPPARSLQIERDILASNDAFAADNRRGFERQGVLALNLVSSPGSGKTTLLVRTIEALQGRTPLAVIEGDQQTSLDAERIRATGAAAVQINTGKGCHLDAQRVQQALPKLALSPNALLFIENVGNLVCPALWDLGEAAKVVILSVTEGDDKPLKYPDMFAAATLMVINKIDLLPYVNFDVAKCIEYARRVNPRIAVLQLSATRGEGMPAWLDWLLREDAALQERP